jgi:hypothetical protein
MPANRDTKEFPLTFEKGLVTEVEDSTLDMGQSASLLNWEPAANGVLRARNAWSTISKTGLPSAPYSVRGFGAIASADLTAAPSTEITFSNLGASANPDISSVSTAASFANTSWTPPSVGLIIVYARSFRSGGGDPNTPTMSGNNLTWVQIATALNATSNHRITLFAANASGSTTGVTTIDFAAQNQDGCRASFMLATNVDLTGGVAAAFVQAPTGSATGTSASITLAAAANAANRPISGWAVSGSVSFTPRTNWTEMDELGGAGHHESQYRADAFETTASATWGGSSQDWVGIAAELKSIPTPPPIPGAISFYVTLALAINATTYNVYRIRRDEIASGLWELLDTVTDSTNTNAWVTLAQGAGKVVWTSSTMSQPRSIDLSTLVASNVSDLSGKAGRSSAYHKDRLFIGGSGLIPGRLYFSNIGVPTTFTTATDYLDIGGDDGEAIQDVISVEGLLLVCKVNRLYLISGSGIESFFVNELPGGSAAGGRPAIRTPYGTIVAGADDIWVVQGGGVDPMSRPLGSGYGITGNVSTAYGQDTVLISDSATGNVWRVNLITGAWGEESVGFGGTERIYHLFSLNGRLYYGTDGGVDQVGGQRKLADARTYDATSIGTTFRASTGKMSMMGPQYKYSPLHLFVQLRNHEPTKPNVITLTVATNLGEQPPIPKTVTQAVQRERIDIGADKGVEWLQVSYECHSSPTAGSIDVEKGVLTVILEEGR